MKMLRGMVVTSLVGVATLAGAALAETKVEVQKVHLCCGQCVKGVATALKGTEGAKAVCDQKKGTVTITADDDSTAQKALDALATAGYHGETGSTTLVIKKETNVPTGKVKSITLSNLHNCCRSCSVAIKKAVGGVGGVSGDTVKAKTADFEVTGDFTPAEVVDALNAAGFHVQIKK